MAHGTSATIPMVVDRYAEVFAAAGVSALLYDHRNLGISGGESRQEITPWVQSRGYRDAITFASTIEDHDPAPAISHGVRDIIFQTGGQIYSIVAFGGATPEQLANVEPAVLSLASTIVNKQD